MRVHELIQLLRALPANAEVCTWDGAGESDLVIEQVLLVQGHRSPVVVLGAEITGDIVEGAEVVWTEHETAHKGIVKAQARWARARREAVG
jgi:hypothetical protein